MVCGISKLLALAALLATVAAQSCPCAKIYFPLCGSDGTTYDNDCTFRCAKAANPHLTLQHKGSCESKRSPRSAPFNEWKCACPLNYSPVCGSDGNTYRNDCTFNCAQNTNVDLHIIHKGKCSEDRRKRSIGSKQVQCPCTRELNLTCGSNGRTYANPCLLKCAARSVSGLKGVHLGPCLSKKKN